MEYSPDSLEPYPTPISKEEIDRKQKFVDSLSRYDNTLLFSDLTVLNLRGAPKDTSHFYKHTHKNLYLRTRRILDTNHTLKIEWTNVTKEYDWEKIMSNPDIPMTRCRSSFFSWIV